MTEIVSVDQPAPASPATPSSGRLAFLWNTRFLGIVFIGFLLVLWEIAAAKARGARIGEGPRPAAGIALAAHRTHLGVAGLHREAGIVAARPVESGLCGRRRDCEAGRDRTG